MRKLTNLFLLSALIVLVTFTGCKEVESFSEKPSEIVSEEPSEVVSEEPSEVISEEPSEEVFEVPESGVLETSFLSVYELTDFIKETEKTTILSTDISYDAGIASQTLLYNNGKYTLEDHKVGIGVISAKEIEEITSSASYVKPQMPRVLDSGDMIRYIFVETTGVDIEVPLTVHYTDGTEETITVYVTKDWEYGWE